MANIGTWTHPATGEVRIYINNLPGQYSAKVFAVRKAADAFGDTISIQVQSRSHSRGEAGNLANEAEDAINALAGARIKDFDQLAALVK